MSLHEESVCHFISSLPDLAWLTIIITSVMSASGRSRGSILGRGWKEGACAPPPPPPQAPSWVHH